MRVRSLVILMGLVLSSAALPAVGFSAESAEIETTQLENGVYDTAANYCGLRIINVEGGGLLTEDVTTRTSCHGAGIVHEYDLDENGRLVSMFTETSRNVIIPLDARTFTIQAEILQASGEWGIEKRVLYTRARD
jgi:hypothetical protein